MSYLMTDSLYEDASVMALEREKQNIACGISGQIQHTAGMDQSSMIISINTDAEAPICKIADFAITGDVNEVIPKMIKYYKQNSK